MSGTTPLTQTASSRIAAQAAGAAVAGAAVAETPFAGTVTGASLTPDGAITGATATKRTFEVVNEGQTGAGTTVVATLDFVTGVDGVQGDEKAFALSAVEGATTVAAGDVLTVKETVAGAGTANPGGLIQVTFARA